MFNLLRENERLVLWMIIASAVMFVGTLIVLPILIVRMPADYFLHRKPPPDSWRGQHAAIRLAVLFIKNVVGSVLLVAGLVMLAMPGQGLLAILVGLSLMNVPGKRALELRMIQIRPVLKAINWIRAKYGRPPLELPAKS